MFKEAEIFVLSSDSRSSLTKNRRALDEIAKILTKHTQEFRVLGFDCEWVTYGRCRNPVALLQISTHRKFVFLIRHTILFDLPVAFKKILSDWRIIKVGVAPIQDARYLFQDYGIEVNGCLDLRFLAGNGAGLASLAKKYLNLTMDKDLRVQCSNWEADTLTWTQIEYAAKDVLAAFEIFKKLIEIDNSSVTRYLDVPYSAKPNYLEPSINDFLTPCNAYYTYLPDGTMFSMCDRKRAQWYVDNNIGTIVSEQRTGGEVQLFFVPKGRYASDPNEIYYQYPKNNNKCLNVLKFIALFIFIGWCGTLLVKRTS